MSIPYEPFVEGWDFVETLGEGAYGEVRLAINRKTQEAVAVKIVNADKLQENGDNLRKEVCIHKMMQDSHIIKFFGQRTENERIFLFLEYAPGGELFDRIEPDVGMPMSQAHKYFKQLINGVEYIHSKGVTHRDIKPENLLIDVEGNLKITDFGLSTVFRYKDKERDLERCCGTPPYVAPEVLRQVEYKAQPADLWSCGIVLTAMIGGELPWDEPSEKCKEYAYWAQNKILHTPWTKIDTITLGFLKRLLHPTPRKRYTIAELKREKWFIRTHSSLKSKSPRSGASPGDAQSFKRHCSNATSTTPLAPKYQITRVSLSQPHPYTNSEIEEEEGEAEEGKVAWFSQPLNIEDMLLSQISQVPTTPGSSQNPFAHLVKRMTRFNVTLPLDEGMKTLSKILEKMTLQYKVMSQNKIRITTVDKRKSTLTYLVNFIVISQLPLLLDFRLAKGDGIEFKRQFKSIKEKMSEYLV